MERMTKNFIEMARILSPSGNEKKLGDYLIKKLRKFSDEILRDENGNIIVKINGNKNTNPFLLSAHLDTVKTSKKPIIKIEKDKIKTENKAILGADCKAGIAIIIELVKTLFENKIPHPPLELVFTVGEEVGLLGSSKLNKQMLNSKFGLVLDNEKSVENVVIKSVGVDNFEIEIKGKAAHSGVDPEKGISAIKIMAKIIDKIDTGRLSKNTTLNIGFIEGGNGINIVPEKTKIKGEIRGFDRKEMDKIEKTIDKIVKQTIKRQKHINGSPNYFYKITKRFDCFSIKPNNPFIKTLKKSYLKNGIIPNFTKSFGGTDANNFYRMGIITPNIPTGMKNVHSDEEYLDLSEFKKSFKIILTLIKELGRE